MALALDTGHALYADIVACICVDDDNTVKDLRGDTCTPHANVVIGSGTYGRHFRTLLNGSNAEGVALTAGHLVKPVSTPVGTTVVVINAGNSRTSRGCVTNGPTTNAPGPACYTGDVPAGHVGGTANPSTLGTTDIIGTGAHMFAVGWNGTSANFVYCDGAMEANPSTNLGNANDTYKATYIGGTPSGGYGGLAADYVWYVHFRKYLSEAELDALYTSLGSGNAFALVDAGIIEGDLDATEAADVAAITGDVIITGTIAATESADTAAFSGGSTPVTGDLDATEASDTAAATGTVRNPRLVIGPLKNNTGTLLASETGATVYVYQTSGAHVVTKTGQTTNGSAIMTVSDAALAAGTTYRYVIALASGAEGMDKQAAA